MGKIHYNWATKQHNKAQTMCFILGMHYSEPLQYQLSAVTPFTNMEKL